MKNEIKDPAAYVQKVHRDTQRYVADLLAENEALRLRIAGLEGERSALERRLARLEERATAAGEDLRRERRAHEELRQRLDEVESQNRAASERYVQVEQQNTNLAKLYVAGYRLHGTLDREEVLAAIQEIIINLVGCEELAIFESAAGELRLVSSFGIDTERYRKVPLDAGRIGAVARGGEAYLTEASGAPPASALDEHLTACIPLTVEGRVNGVIAIFRLLPQKERGLEDLDREMLDLLSAQAGIALYCSALHARSRSIGAAEEGKTG